ncbi:MAG: hypoxanthine phosphoribosyltransferase [Clostridiales bacterium]|nr:hypoxanthine phosphoribosyltransferase [Clostridiales bacterium]
MKIKTLYDSSEVSARIKELGDKISAKHNDGKPILCVCVLRGAFMFFSELVKHIKGEVIVDFITLSSYEATSSTGKINLISGLRESIEDRHVLIIEDIIDSGRTIKFLREYFADKNALSVEVACLIDKPMTRQVEAAADYIAFTLTTPAFIVGYGLDYDQRFRNLDGIMEIDLEQ